MASQCPAVCASLPSGWRLTATLKDVYGGGRVDAAEVSVWPALYIIMEASAALCIRRYVHVQLARRRQTSLPHRSIPAISPSPALRIYLSSQCSFAFPTRLDLSPHLTPHGLCFEALALVLRIRASFHCRGLSIPLHDSGTVRLQTIPGGKLCCV